MQAEPDHANSEPIALEALLAPLPLERFLAETFGKAPLYVAGAKGRFRSLLDWDGLAQLLENSALEPPRLTIVKGGTTIPAARYLRPTGGGIARIDGGALGLLLDTGASAIINHVDDLVPAIGELADEVGDALGARTAVNLYATWRSEPGFAAHWDYHDVIVLQLAGRKQWPIYQPTRRDPLRGDPFEAPPAGAQPDLVETLEDGDLLYLPRGWIHAPLPGDEPSLHLTFAITRPTGAGFLAWLAKELEAEAEVRAAIPAVWDEEALVEWKRGLTAIIQRCLEGGTLERHLMHKDAERGARPHFSFPDFGRIPQSEWTSATSLRLASLHRLIVETRGDGRSEVTAAGRQWPCSEPVAAALRRLTSTRSCRLATLEAGLDEADASQLRQLLALLLAFGQLHVE